MKMFRRPYKRVYKDNNVICFIITEHLFDNLCEMFSGPFYSFDTLTTYKKEMYEISKDVSEIFHGKAFDYEIRFAADTIIELCQAKSPEEHISFLRGFARILRLTKNTKNAIKFYNEIKDK